MAKRKKTSRSASPSRGAKNQGPPSTGPREGLGFDPTLIGLWCLLLLPPVIFVPGLTDNFRLPKLLLTEILGLFSLFCLAWRLWRVEKIDFAAVARRPLVLATVPLVFLVSLSWWLGEHPEVTHRALPSLWIGAACLIGWSLALGHDERQRLLRLLMWPAAGLALLAVLQFHGIYDPFQFQDRVTDRIRLTSLAGGAFDLSGYLVLPILIAQASWARASLKGRWLIAIFLVLGLWASVASRTVTAILALVVGSGLLWRRRLPRTRLLAAGTAAALLLAVLAVFGPLSKRADQMTESLRKGEINRLLTGRLDAWRSAVWMLGENPVFGVGHGAFRAEYGPARLALSEQGVKFFRGQRQVFFTNAHSDLLNAVAEWGLVGSAALLAGLGLLGRALRRRHRVVALAESAEDEDDAAAEVLAGLARPINRDLEIAALASLGVLSLTYFPLHLGLLSYPWLLFASGLFVAPKDSSRSDSSANDKPRARFLRLPGRAVMVACTVLLAFACSARFQSARQLIGANRLLAATEASTLQAASMAGAVPPALLRRNLEWLRQAATLDPAEVGIPLAEGGQYFLMERYQAAERAYQRALALEMRGEIYANLARCHLAADNRQAAMAAIGRAVALDHTQHRNFKDVLRIETQRRRKRAREGGG